MFMVSEDDHFLAKNVVSPLLEILHNGVQLFSYVEYLLTVSLNVSKLNATGWPD